MEDGGPFTAGLRPNDVTIRRVDGSDVSAVDVTVTTDLATPAEKADEDKKTKHGPDFKNSSSLFHPFGVTVQGNMGSSAKAVIAMLVSHIAKQPSRMPSRTSKPLTATLSGG
jgi:hypothetical protein